MLDAVLEVESERVRDGQEGSRNGSETVSCRDGLDNGAGDASARGSGTTSGPGDVDAAESPEITFCVRARSSSVSPTTN